jgi:hypothetical protein
MKFNASLMWVLLLLILVPACSLPASKSDQLLNQSALHDPPMVRMKPGVEYQFAEGTLMGRGQLFHSDYSYQTAFLLGQKTK